MLETENPNCVTYCWVRLNVLTVIIGYQLLQCHVCLCYCIITLLLFHHRNVLDVRENSETNCRRLRALLTQDHSNCFSRREWKTTENRVVNSVNSTNTSFTLLLHFCFCTFLCLPLHHNLLHSKMRNFALKLSVLLLIFLCVCSSSSRSRVEAKCKKGCDLALASYYLWRGVNLTFISKMFDTSIETIQSFNPQITDRDKILAGTRISVPFTCNCIQKQFLGHNFSYLVKSGNTYRKIAELIYANLTTVDWLRNSNIYDEDHLPDVGSMINVIVNCSCGEKSVSKDYGLFVTYPLRPGENLSGVVDESEIPSDLLQKYNPTSDFSSGSGLIFFPGRGKIFMHF